MMDNIGAMVSRLMQHQPVTSLRSPVDTQDAYTKYSNAHFDVIIMDNTKLPHIVVDKRIPEKHIVYNGLRTACIALGLLSTSYNSG